MSDSLPIPPRPPDDHLHTIMQNVTKDKHLLKVKLDKSWNPIGVTTQSKDEARSGLFGRIIVWIHAAEYDLETNVKHLKTEIEKMQKSENIDSKQFEDLQLQYNGLIDEVAQQKFQKKWYNFFTTDEEIKKQREEFSKIKFIIATDKSSDHTTKVTKPLFPEPVSSLPAENTAQLTQATEQDLDIHEGESTLERPTLGRLKEPSAEVTAVPIAPVPVTAEPNAVTTHSVNDMATVNQVTVLQPQEPDTVAPIQAPSKKIIATFEELTKKFSAISQQEDTTLGKARTAIQSLGNSDAVDWQERLQQASQANEAAKEAYLDLLKKQALDRAVKIKNMQAQTMQVLEAIQALGLRQGPHASIAQLTDLEQAFGAISTQIEQNVDVYQTAKESLDALEEQLKTALQQLAQLKNDYAKASVTKKETLLSEIQKLSPEVAGDTILSRELASAQRTLQSPLVKGKEHEHSQGLKQVEEQLKSVKAEIEKRKAAFAPFFSQIQRNRELLQGKLAALPDDATASTVLKKNYLTQLLREITELGRTITVTTQASKIPTGLVKIPFEQLDATVEQQLQVINRAFQRGFSLGAIEKALVPTGDEIQIVHLPSVMNAIDQLAQAVKMVDLLQEKANVVSPSGLNPVLLQYESQYLTAQQETLRKNSEMVSSITLSTVDKQLEKMAEEFEAFADKIVVLARDLDTRKLPDEEQMDTILGLIFACHTITESFDIQIDEAALEKLRVQISALPKK